jgi:hypothetical protein
VQVLLQFTCGYHDVDLRDSTGLGHGLLIAAHATPQVRDRWVPRLLAGAVPGIAITEPHGGSQVRATATHAVPADDGTWRLSGTKTWISRLTEAAVFCVFFTAPDGRLTAAVIDAGAGGLSRRLITPSGLSGWAWGELRLDGVTVRPCDILGQPGDGLRLLRDHFARYRPLVAATALQAASELALLAGAVGFTADSRTAKARSDLNALLYADGIHDSLYSSAGRTLTGPGRAGGLKPALPVVPAMREGRDETLVRSRGLPPPFGQTAPRGARTRQVYLPTDKVSAQLRT